MNATSTKPTTLCVAWVDMSGVELTGRYRDRLQQTPEVRYIPKAKACIWVLASEEGDLAKAQAYAAPRGYIVIDCGDREDPQDYARSCAMSMHNAGTLKAVS